MHGAAFQIRTRVYRAGNIRDLGSPKRRATGNLGNLMLRHEQRQGAAARRRLTIPARPDTLLISYKTWRLLIVRAETLDSTFSALADPTRRAILARLASGEASVKEVGESFEMTQPAVSKHLKVLERAGLVSRGRDGQRRPSRIEAKPLAEVADYIERYRGFWEEGFGGLDEYLQELKKKEGGAE